MLRMLRASDHVWKRDDERHNSQGAASKRQRTVEQWARRMQNPVVSRTTNPSMLCKHCQTCKSRCGSIVRHFVDASLSNATDTMTNRKGGNFCVSRQSLTVHLLPEVFESSGSMFAIRERQSAVHACPHSMRILRSGRVFQPRCVGRCSACLHISSLRHTTLKCRDTRKHNVGDHCRSVGQACDIRGSC